MRIEPSLKQFVLLLVNSITSVINKKFLKFFQDFPENLDVNDQRKEKSRWEYWYDWCLMNHEWGLLWKHKIFRIFGLLTDFPNFSRQSYFQIWIPFSIISIKLQSYSRNLKFSIYFVLGHFQIES